MSATYHASSQTLLPIEGGYCSGGMACGSKASGETYRGIDRGQWPGWAGWKTIDAYKKKYGAPKWNTYIKDPAIDKAVEDFYTANFWNKLGFNTLNNQTLAALVYVFAVQRMYDAIGVFNGVAVNLGCPVAKISKYKITPDASQALEKNVVLGYGTVRQAIVDYYRKRYAAADAAKYIKNRVEVFPPMLGPAGSSSSPSTTTGGLESLGILFTIAKFFF